MESTTLKENRQKLGLSQTQLGKRLGVSRKTVLNYESGITAIPETKAQLLNLIFNINQPKIKKAPRKSANEIISDKVIDRMIPYFTQLEATITELKCEMEAMKLYMKLGEEIEGE